MKELQNEVTPIVSKEVRENIQLQVYFHDD